MGCMPAHPDRNSYEAKSLGGSPPPLPGSQMSAAKARHHQVTLIDHVDRAEANLAAIDVLDPASAVRFEQPCDAENRLLVEGEDLLASGVVRDAGETQATGRQG